MPSFSQCYCSYKVVIGSRKDDRCDKTRVFQSLGIRVLAPRDIHNNKYSRRSNPINATPQQDLAIIYTDLACKTNTQTTILSLNHFDVVRNLEHIQIVVVATRTIINKRENALLAHLKYLNRAHFKCFLDDPQQ